MAKKTPKVRHTIEQDSMLDELLQNSPSLLMPKAGTLVHGTVFALKKNRILVDLSGTSTGIISGRESRDRSNTIKKLKEGDPITAYVIEDENPEGLIVLSLRKASQEKTWEDFQSAYENGNIIEVRPHEANKGGLLLEIDGIKGFIPVSQLAPLHYPRVNGADSQRILERLQKLIGISFKVKIINIDKENGKLILSEKAGMEEQRRNALSKLNAGQKVKGKISGVVKFGIFVAFDGLEGLVHISEIAWGHVNDPSDYGKLGNEVEVLIIGIENEKISLSMKRLVPDPWIEAAKTFQVGKIIESEITRITEFGAFIKLNDEINGLIHLSEVTDDLNIKDIGQILKSGQKVRAKIIAVDLEEHRIGLSIKALEKDKKEQDKSIDESKDATKKNEKTNSLQTIPGVSAKTAKALESAGIQSIDDLKGKTKEDLVALEGIGEKTAEKLVSLAK